MELLSQVVYIIEIVILVADILGCFFVHENINRNYIMIHVGHNIKSICGLCGTRTANCCDQKRTYFILNLRRKWNENRKVNSCKTQCFSLLKCSKWFLSLMNHSTFKKLPGSTSPMKDYSEGRFKVTELSTTNNYCHWISLVRRFIGFLSDHNCLLQEKLEKKRL